MHWPGVKEVIITSILPTKNIASTRPIQEVNDSLIKQCVLNRFGFISNYNVSRTRLWKDGIQLEDLGTNILAGNFVDFLNRFVLSKSSEHSWLYADIGVLISDNSLSPEIISDISNLGSLSSNWNFYNVKGYDKNSSDPRLVLKI